MKKLLTILSITAVTLFFNGGVAYAAFTSAQSVDMENSASEGQSMTIADASQTGLDFSSDFTIEAWVKPESAGANMTIVAKKDTNQEQYTFVYRQSGGPLLRLTVNQLCNGTDQDILDKTTTLSNGTWYHVKVTYTLSTKTAEFYVNGTSIGTTVGANVTALADCTSPFAVGVQYDTGTIDGSVGWDGMIDEVRVWSNATQTSDNKCETISSGSGLQGSWLFEGDSTNRKLDETSNNNDLTENNTPSFSSTIPSCAAASTGFSPWQFSDI